MEKLYLMEMAGIGQTPSSNYLINATEFFLLASISHFRFFVSTYLHSTPNGVSILKENLDLDLSNRYSRKTAKVIWHRIGSSEKMKDINCIIKKLLGGSKSKDDFIHGSDAIFAPDKDGNTCSMIRTINS